MTPVQMRDYFDKLGIKNELKPTVADMISLHRAQHRTLPFENFDVFVGQGIKLDIDTIFEKLIRHQRGGYCFEVNGLLLRVMESLGFTVRPLLARVHLSGEPSGRSHQVTLATIDDQQWIVDAGFGANTPRAPLELTLHREQCIDHQCFRFIEDERCGYLLQVKPYILHPVLYSNFYQHKRYHWLLYSLLFHSFHVDREDLILSKK